MIREMTHYDAMYVSLNMREIDLRELSLAEGIDDLEIVMSYAALLAMAVDGESWTAFNDRPVAIFGVNKTEDGNIIWMWGTDEFPSCKKEITAFCRKRIPELVKKMGELKCYSAGFHNQIHRWLELVGLNKKRVVGDFVEYGVKYA